MKNSSQQRRGIFPRLLLSVLAVFLMLSLAACGGSSSSGSSTSSGGSGGSGSGGSGSGGGGSGGGGNPGSSVPDHIVVVMEENHSYEEVIGSSDAPYINSLAQQGALFTNSTAITHPSQPNYLDLFSGGNQGVTDDSCPQTLTATNLESELIAAGKTFVGYAEDLPSTGSTVCSSGEYARKHAPWTNFANDPASDSQPFSAFPSDYSKLPTISWVIPNLLDDMHDGTVAEGDTWLETNIKPYADWAQANNSLLIVTWDEDDGSSGNHIATIFYGAVVKTGQYSEAINHYGVLRAMEDKYGLPLAGNSASAPAVTDVWK